ncbi:TerC family protein [Buchnera aphidicola]|uniref:TerC family protein n=1 Tax=Buchnera aphidicola TaxID=9 RepID=UPI003464D3C3
MQIANENIICFLTSYLLEILLSIDNVFAWFLIFKFFKIPLIYQKKVLLYGLWGALIFRSIFSFFGFFLFIKWSWILYFFGIFFIYTSVKIIFCRHEELNNKEDNIKFLWIYKFFRVTRNIDNEKFFVKIEKKLFVTPLFISLILIEFSDIIFSVDSIPAIFSITHNFFIIFFANFFAAICLRSMYLFTSNLIKNFPLIQYALPTILVFLGFKILIEKFFSISIFLTLSVIITILIAAFLLNIIFNYKNFNNIYKK